MHVLFFISGGMNMSVMDGCLVAEELGYGCTGIKTALEASGLGVRKKKLLVETLFNSICIY